MTDTIYPHSQARENYHKHYSTFPLNLFSILLCMCLHIRRGSVCKVLFSIPFVSHYILSLSPVIRSSIMWMNQNLLYYYVPLGYLGCFKFYS